ncbi:hypothetical protein IFM89_030257 [Coptis chinensis]|uniref:Leucine-rich repeat-containing N-terminal plant-type domain-containing protein n=1 Tax=Coptis chinensis TaxID=261450 RepID=A0A835HXF6_9MAGN|nr:hypothetical protein IFM89_030257 [Coptis chinensis]
MERIAFRMLFLYYFLLLHGANSVEEDIKLSLIKFLEKLSPSNGIIMDPNFGWNMSSDPCAGHWKGVTCEARSISVKKIVLDNFSLNGTLDDESLCSVQSIILLSLNNNNISGEIPREIADCKELTHFYVSGNRFVGSVPALLFSNLKRLDISNNYFLGELPALPAISSLVSFRAKYNQLNGAIHTRIQLP